MESAKTAGWGIRWLDGEEEEEVEEELLLLLFEGLLATFPMAASEADEEDGPDVGFVLDEVGWSKHPWVSI